MSQGELSILVIGSQPLRQRLTSALGAVGEAARIELLTDVARASGAVAQDDYDIYVLEDMDTWDAVAAIREAFNNGARSPMLFLTDDEVGGADIAAIEAGAVDALPKRGADLARAIRYARSRAWRLATQRPRPDSSGGASAQLEALLSGTRDGTWEWDLEVDRIHYSPSWFAQVGLPENTNSESPDVWLERVHPDDVERLRRQVRAYLDGRTPRFEVYYRLRHQLGGYRWMISRGLAFHGPNGSARRVVGVQTDISAGSKLMGEEAREALHDRLTGLPSRTILLDRLTQCINRSDRSPNYFFAVVSLDIDRFSMINNSLGHIIGDQLLVEFARRVQSSLRVGDTVARIGADEFTVLLDGVNGVSEAKEICRRIDGGVRLPFRLGGHEVFATASYGVAVSRTRYDKPEDLLRDAALALRRAKEQGGSHQSVFDTTMHTEAVQTQLIEMSLRKAIERAQLRLHYQPIYSLASGRIAGFEALLRWDHPVRGLLPPLAFIPIAESSDLIVEMGRWVLIEACRQLKQWRERFGNDFYVAVNVSAKHFRHTELIDHVATALQESDLPPQLLALEITESRLMEYVGACAPVLQWLKNMDIALQIDDFGTGYSSLSYLTHLPVRALKIDRSFTRSMTTDNAQHQIVRAIISLARCLELQVTAEGVETKAQLEALQLLDCDFAQGHYLGYPQPPDKIEELLEGGG